VTDQYDGDVPFALPMTAEFDLASAPTFRSIICHDRLSKQFIHRSPSNEGISDTSFLTLIYRGIKMINQADINGVIFNHEITENINNITKDFDLALKSLGAKRYAYFYSGRHDQQPSIITNLPDEWLAEYEEGYLYNVDPVLDISKNTIIPFSWMTQGLNNTYNNQLAANALKYKIIKGHTFVSISHSSDIGVLTICADDNDPRLDSTIKDHKAEIQFALLSHHERFEKQYNQNRKSTRDKQIKKLSWREREVLNWIGCGKTYSETAMILSISERTIKFHISNIKNKLNVYSSRQAISIASEYGLIDNQ